MNPSFREILELLNKHQVEYVVIGGVAAVIHGAPVTTFDLDALVPSNQSAGYWRKFVQLTSSNSVCGVMHIPL